jgi:predicted RNA-binding Zn ribbon-like protein
LNTSIVYLLVLIASTSKNGMLVSMKLSEKYAVPSELALLYDFVNTLDQRRYVEDGAAHAGGDEIATPTMLQAWMNDRGLLPRGSRATAREHAAALELRAALRAFLLIPPAERSRAKEEARRLTAASRRFPLTLGVSDKGVVGLHPVPDSSTLGRVLGQMLALAQADRLTRLKTCASDECHWVFFDRSKPANRHWCSSSRCGNRQKTRNYRARQALARS